MAEVDYLLAALPDRFVIMGQLLRPFSLGHLMILKRMGNVFVESGKRITLADFDHLVSGVLVCSHTYDAANELLQNPKLPKIVKQWGKRLGKFNIPAKMREFAAYIKGGCTRPEMAIPDGNGCTPGAPFLQRLKIVLQTELNHTESEALNKPFGLAIHDYCALFEINRAIRILTDEDKQAADELAAEAKRLEKELPKLRRQARRLKKRMGL